jgi:hypothetical protein
MDNYDASKALDNYIRNFEKINSSYSTMSAQFKELKSKNSNLFSQQQTKVNRKRFDSMTDHYRGCKLKNCNFRLNTDLLTLPIAEDSFMKKFDQIETFTSVLSKRIKDHKDDFNKNSKI